MTLDQIKALVVQADPDAQHYWSSSTARNYTTWREYNQLDLIVDDKHVEGWQFQIDRFTMLEHDPVVDVIRQLLNGTPEVSYQYLVDFEGLPNAGGLIHHIFDCQG